MLSPLNFRGDAGTLELPSGLVMHSVTMSCLQTPFADMVVSQPQWVVTSVQC